jgi:RNA polymerase sigma factor (TIGR02999 family)
MYNRGMSGAASLTDLIHRARDGDEAALRSVFDITYNELRGLARARLSKGGRGAMLDTTSLVHESYLRFANAGRLRIEDRQHFMRYAGHVMRSVIVDFVRERSTQRRGGDVPHVTLNSHIGDVASEGEGEILRVHEALNELTQHDARMVHVVEMRYFAGMTESEIADALGVTDRTVRRDWEKARLLLAEALS